jgi:ADP-ribose pyrophosphatase
MSKSESEHENWQVLASEVIIHDAFLTVEMQQLQLPDGKVIDNWSIIDAHDYAMIVAENEAGELLILDGYRHGLGRSSWQVVGGHIEQDEEPLATAQRELLEEAGYASNEWTSLGSFIVDANRRVSQAHFFLARRACQSTKLISDDLEQSEIKWVSPAEAKQALRDGRVAISSSALALALALDAMNTAG